VLRWRGKENLKLKIKITLLKKRGFFMVETENGKEYRQGENLDSLVHEAVNGVLPPDIGNQILNEYARWSPEQKINIIGLYKGYFRKQTIPENSLGNVEGDILHFPNRKIKFNGVIFLPTINPSNLSQNLPSVLGSLNKLREEGYNFLLAIIFDGVDSKSFRVDDDSCIIFRNPRNKGYLRAIKTALDFVRNNFLDTEDIYAGFLDDDARLLDVEHYLKLIKLLERGYVVVSGLAVDANSGYLLHDFFNIPTNIEVVNRAREMGIDISRRHIHGGGGGCLTRLPFLREGVEVALVNDCLLGPTLSALADLKNKSNVSIATQDTLVLHPTKSTFYDW
jgi:hypothetical protein